MVGPASQGEERLLAPRLPVASAPHVRTPETIPRIMWTVNATLLPVAIWGVYVFGWRALAHVLVCVVSAVVCEWAIQKFRGVRPTWHDGSAFLTGLLLAF